MLRGFNYLLYDFIDFFCDIFGITERYVKQVNATVSCFIHRACSNCLIVLYLYRFGL